MAHVLRSSSSAAATPSTLSTPRPARSTGGTTTPGRPGQPPNPNQDGTRIFSSPVVVDGLVLFGVDVDGQRNSRGYIVGASLQTGKPVWEFQTDVDAAGHVLERRVRQRVVVGDGACPASGSSYSTRPTVTSTTPRISPKSSSPSTSPTGTSHGCTDRPSLDLDCDWDFGATPNAGITPQGRATFLGVGGKDGTYYSLNPATGQLRWATNVVFGGFSGGFIATTAFDGHRVYGSTALGDYGRFEKDTSVLCDPSNPRDTATQNPTVHAFDAATGAVAWQAQNGASFAATTVAGGMTFNGPAVAGPILVVRDAATGTIVTQVKLPGSSWSGVATVGDALVTGIGASAEAQPAGVVALTPGGSKPVVPRGG